MGTAVLFPGQGSQFVGMGEDLYQKSATARAFFDEADALLGYSLSTICFSGPEDKLTETIYQQPAMFTMSIASWNTYLSSDGVAVDFIAGHSLGEFSALVAAGSMQFADGLNLVKRRGELMQLAGERQPGAMAAILALDVSIVVDLCSQASKETGLIATVANDNCPGQLVISGHTEAVELVMSMAVDAGARKVVKLPISIAAHSDLMRSVGEEFARAVDETRIVAPSIPVIGNVSAQPLLTADYVRQEIKDQLTSSVAWTASMRYLLSQGMDTFVEVGPGKVLLSLMKRIDRKTKRIKYELDA